MEKINLYFPEKSIKINEEDQPWITPELKKLDRQGKREYLKHKRSRRWEKLN